MQHLLCRPAHGRYGPRLRQRAVLGRSRMGLLRHGHSTFCSRPSRNTPGRHCVSYSQPRGTTPRTSPLTKRKCGPTKAQRVVPSNDAEMRRHLERLEALSAAAFDGIGISQDGIVVEANEQLAALLHCDLRALIGAEITR